MKKKMRLLSIILTIIGIGMILLAVTLNLDSIVRIIGAVILIIGALTGAFTSSNGENKIGSYHSPRV